MEITSAYEQLKIVEDFVPVGNSNRPGKLLKASSITVHNTDNTSKGANAAAHAKYMKGAHAQKRKVSWHYTVDDKFVFQSIPTNEVTWHAGTKAGNESSIAIEICMNSDLDEDAAYERAELLAAVVCYKHGFKPRSQLFQHNDWSGKNCPRVLRARQNGWKNFVSGVDKKLNALKDAKVAALEFSDEVPEDACEACAYSDR